MTNRTDFAPRSGRDDQLRLIDGGRDDDVRPQWRLDDETIALGREGIKAARAALLSRRADLDDRHAA